MRNIWLSIAILGASAGVAQAEHRGSDAEAGPIEPTARARARAMERTLSMGDINAQVKPVSAEIGKCFLDAVGGTRGGHLVVQLAIHRRGKLDAVSVSTPGLPAKLASKIEGCVRGIVEPLEFPVRRTPTTAVLPYYFQHTAAPNAGPQLSCFSSSGCPGR